MELAEGGDLYDFIKTGRLDPDIVCLFFKKIVAGLEYMHGNGVYNRDIKPENILLNSNLELKIADFGFSKNRYEMGGS